MSNTILGLKKCINLQALKISIQDNTLKEVKDETVIGLTEILGQLPNLIILNVGYSADTKLNKQFLEKIGGLDQLKSLALSYTSGESPKLIPKILQNTKNISKLTKFRLDVGEQQQGNNIIEFHEELTKLLSKLTSVNELELGFPQSSMKGDKQAPN